MREATATATVNHGGGANGALRPTLATAPSARAPRGEERRDVLGLLAASSRGAGLLDLAARFDALEAWLAEDLGALEAAIAAAGADRSSVARRAAHHLLTQPGKRIRPLCVLLAAQAGPHAATRREAIVHLAVAAELAHAATLLHDDVIDLGDERRGASTARVVYGNPASVLGGDHVLVSALRHVDAAGVPRAMTELIDVIDRMVAAEALQIERRARKTPTDAVEARAAWRAIAAGKTGALFAWAMRSGARAAGVAEADVERLGRFGAMLGEAFQLADDALDLDGDPSVTGKDALLDVREGKPTWPFAVAVERDPGLAEALYRLASTPPDAVEPSVSAALRARIVATGALTATWKRAAEVADEAIALLDAMPPFDGSAALAAVVSAAARRDR